MSLSMLLIPGFGDVFQKYKNLRGIGPCLIIIRETRAYLIGSFYSVRQKWNFIEQKIKCQVLHFNFGPVQ